MSDKLYAERDIIHLDRVGNYYTQHIVAMTREGLHSKSDIAAELAWRDHVIGRLIEMIEQQIGNGWLEQTADLL